MIMRFIANRIIELVIAKLNGKIVAKILKTLNLTFVQQDCAQQCQFVSVRRDIVPNGVVRLSGRFCLLAVQS